MHFSDIRKILTLHKALNDDNLRWIFNFRISPIPGINSRLILVGVLNRNSKLILIFPIAKQNMRYSEISETSILNFKEEKITWFVLSIDLD